MDKLSRMRREAESAYPSPGEVDAWAEGLLIGSEKVAVEGAVLDDMLSLIHISEPTRH